MSGADLAHLADNGYDQRFKLILPLAGAAPGDAYAQFPTRADWFAPWRALPEDRRNPMRTYTIRAVRRQRREMDFDVVLHGEEQGGASGPASRWAAGATIGDRLIVVGPDARHPGPHHGLAWHPPPDARLLIAGDETALPAIAAIIERLPDDASGHALLEVPTALDALDEVVPPPDVQLLWFFRGDREPGELLGTAVRQLVGAAAGPGPEPDLPDQDDDGILWDVDEAAPVTGRYAWLAGEAGIITDLRRYLIREAGLPRPAVASMGYWRLGRAEN